MTKARTAQSPTTSTAPGQKRPAGGFIQEAPSDRLTPVGRAGASPWRVALYSWAWTLGALFLFATGHRLWTPWGSATAHGPESNKPEALMPGVAPHTERELARLCRAVETNFLSVGQPQFEIDDADDATKWSVLRTIRSQHLSMAWQCHLAPTNDADRWECHTRPQGGARYGLVLEGDARHAMPVGQRVLALSDLRRALMNGDAQLAIGPQCDVQIVVRSPELLNAP